MAVLSGSDTVAAISQSTGCCGLNLVTNHNFFFLPLAKVVFFVLLFSKCFSPACKRGSSMHAYARACSHVQMRSLWEMLHFVPVRADVEG